MSLDKKLQKAFDDGYRMGVDDTHQFWIQALRETTGIGKVLKKRLMDKAREIARRKVRK